MKYIQHIKTINYRIAILFFVFALVFSAFFVGQSIKAQTDLTISVNENVVQDGKASIYWNTDKEASCGIDYNDDPDVSGGIGTNGRIIQFGLPTNDGKFYYDVQLTGLELDTNYYYQVNCTLDGDSTTYQSDIKTLSVVKPDLTITDITAFPLTPNVNQETIITVQGKNIGSGGLRSGQGITNLFRSFQDFTITKEVHPNPTVSDPLDSQEKFTFVYTGKFTSMGNKGLSFIVDNANELVEENENNNSLTKTITVGLTKLAISGINGNSEPGNKASIYWRTNVESNCTLAYSTNADTSNGTTLLGNVIQVPTNTNDGLYYYDAKLSGLKSDTVYYYKILCPDSNNNVIESAIKSFNSSGISKPDLTIADVSLTPSNPEVGETVTVNVSVKNLGGSLTSGQGIDSWFASIQDLTWTSGGPALGAARSVTASNPMLNGETILYSGPGVFTSTGVKSTNFRVDNSSELDESNENNNSWTRSIVVGLDGLPDLTISNFKHSRLDVDQDLDTQLEFDLVNVGEAKPVRDFQLVVTNFTNGRLLKDVTYNDIYFTPNDYRAHVYIVGKVGSEFVEGENRIQITIDPENLLIESDESNNNFTKVIRTYVVAPESDEVPISYEVPDDEEQTDSATFSSDELRALRSRIKRLEHKITQLERQVVEAEKRLTRKINKALTKRLKGKILLQVEQNGEAWYVDEVSEERYYLKDGDTAYTALQAFGLGISNVDLEQIPVGVEDRAEKVDSDGDGLDDQLEDAIGTDKDNPDTDGDGFSDGDEIKSDFSPRDRTKLKLNKTLANKLEGKILLQVEGRGEAWYIHNGRRHYMKNGSLAYQIMRFLSLGITNDDIREIGVGELE